MHSITVDADNTKLEVTVSNSFQ